MSQMNFLALNLVLYSLFQFQVSLNEALFPDRLDPAQLLDGACELCGHRNGRLSNLNLKNFFNDLMFFSLQMKMEE